MKNLKASMKLIWPHIIISLMLVAVMIISAVSFLNIRQQVEALYHGASAVKSAAETVHENFEAMQMSVFRALSNDSQDITDEAIADARNCAGIIQEQVAQIQQNTFGNTEILTQLEESLSELAPMQERVLDLAAQNKNAEAVKLMENSNIPVIKEAQEELAQFIQSVEARESELVVSLRQTQRNAVILLISLGVIGVLFGIRGGIYIRRLLKEGKQNMFHPI